MVSRGWRLRGTSQFVRSGNDFIWRFRVLTLGTHFEWICLPFDVIVVIDVNAAAVDDVRVQAIECLIRMCNFIKESEVEDYATVYGARLTSACERDSC